MFGEIKMFIRFLQLSAIAWNLKAKFYRCAQPICSS